MRKPRYNAARLTLAAAVLILVATRAPAEPDIRRDAVVGVVQEVMPCVVNVATESIIESQDPFEEFWRRYYGRPKVASALGSGVIISDDGYILTNLHVVKRARRIQVKLSDAAGGGVYDVERAYVGTSKTDVAVLKIIPKKAGEKFKAIAFANDDDLLLGETVIALGNPFGLGESVSQGILSSKSRAAPKENEDLSMENWLQTDALINPGNSGGPLVDLRGELIGVNVAILKGAQGIGFAIPIKEVRQALSDIFTPETGSRWFGARVGAAAPLVVQNVEAGSPAAVAGMRKGDTVLEVNGEPAGTYIEFNRTLRDSAKLSFDLTLQSGGERRHAQVRLMPFAEFFRTRLGLDLQELTPDLVDQLGLAGLGGVGSGLLISRVEKGSPAQDASLQAYDIINGIENQQVRSYWNAFEGLSGLKAGDKASVSVLVPRTRGNLILGYQEGETELKLR
jgi:S1-C subfamily serine protease